MAKLINRGVERIATFKSGNFTSLNTSEKANRLPPVPRTKLVQRHGHQYSLYGIQENALNYSPYSKPSKF